MSAIDLSIIIVSWNVKKHLKQCLNSLEKARGNLNLEIFVIDNNSSDGSAEMVKKEFLTKIINPPIPPKGWSTSPARVKSRAGRYWGDQKNRPSPKPHQFIGGVKVDLIQNNQNLGFAKANNQAIKKARGQFILLLNPDMKLFPNALTQMVVWMRENPQAKVAGCHLINEQGQTIYHVRRFPTVWNQTAVILKLPHLFPNILNKYLRKNFDYSKSQKVDSIRGGFFMIRAIEGDIRECRLQELDERYFLWFEEVDFCRQVQKSSKEVWYTPAAKCIDYIGQSFKQVTTLKKQKIFKASQLKYFKKWHPSWQYWLLKIVWPIGLLVAWFTKKLNLKSKVNT